MPNIRDVVQALGGREGVDAVILLGHDGLTIDSVVSGSLDSDGIAALVPSVIGSCTRFGAESGREQFSTGVIEYSGGFAIIAQLTPETVLAVLIRPGVNVGSLLYDLRRHRVAIAELL
jgi:predicted regulator of Ras-like GTPase activity (Roadblock/LC7/MglB family)